MCTVLDRVESKGIQHGILQGAIALVNTLKSRLIMKKRTKSWVRFSCF